ncbi:AzlC family ABC transporter permease [Natrinema halophilum]|uniref:AzlC family ABC transporter permease n=1 Tax=Natrinema halophilum TaxID=1699371 RepID=A0A7D5KST0_9EURY|nr:AzlC family ABC transporter permease [Natrinema halophilum]QLG50677.1 AzlC family ABC transporter permease [Natrinema halophilum]
MILRERLHPDLFAGIRAAMPLVIGIVPFALITGITAISEGLTIAETVGMSAIVFAGASQLAAIDLIGSNASFIIVVGTAVVINIRMVMYSASIAPYLQPFSLRIRGLAAYLLTDQAYAMSVAEYETNDERHRLWYYVGIAATLWIVWQIGTFVGAVLGASVPDALELNFALPLVFIAVLVPAMKDAGTTAAGVVAGVTALSIATLGVPFNLDLPIAAVIGILSGVVVDAWRTA